MAQVPELFLAPKHYFAQHHPTYSDAKQISARMQDKGFLSWGTFIRANLQLRIEDSIEKPTVRAFKPTKFTASVNRYDRNPYYFKVDPKGQQLPYIDTIEAEIVSDGAVAVAKASKGQLDFAAFTMPTQDIPLLKLGEQNGTIKVNIWRRLHGSDLVIQPNYNHADKRLRHSIGM